MSDDPLVPFLAPPLVMVLRFKEMEKGAPLTEEEVLEIAATAPRITIRQSEAAAMAAARGYDDIAPERAWEEWRAVRPGRGF